MPALHSAGISAKLLQQLGGGTVIGPVLTGLSHSVQTGATVAEIVTAAALAALDAKVSAGPLMGVGMAVMDIGEVAVAVDHGRMTMGMEMRLARRI